MMRAFIDRLGKRGGIDIGYFGSAGFWMGASTVATAVWAFALYVAFARLIPPDAYGLYQFVLSIASVLGAFTLTGMNNAIVRAVSRHAEGELRVSVKLQLQWAVLPFAIALGVAGYYAYMGNGIIAAAVLITGFFVPITNAFNTYAAFLIGKGAFRSSFWYGQIYNLFYYGAILTALFLTHNPLLLVLVNLGVGCAVTAVLYVLVVRRYRPNDVRDGETIRFGAHLSVANVLSTMFLQLDNILVFHFLGAVPLAMYAFATNIPERVGALFRNVSVAALPKLSVRSPSAIRSSIVTQTLKFSVLTALGFLAYAAGASILFEIFFPAYGAAVPYTQVYALVLVLNLAAGLLGTALVAAKATREIYVYNMTNPIYGTLLMLVGVYYFGLWGIIAARGTTNLLNVLFLLTLLWRMRGGEDAVAPATVVS